MAMTFCPIFFCLKERNRPDFLSEKSLRFCSFVHWEQTGPAVRRSCTKPQWGEEILDMTTNYTNPEEGT